LPKVSDLTHFLRLLPRSATGQILTSYFSLITGARKEGDATGAKHLHIVLLDNGRSQVAKGELREILKCIRCGACMNVCPVYGVIGGHAYDSTYPGPMGVILSAVLNGLERSHPLLDASTLCGACSDVCPVKVPLTKLINRLREIKVESGLSQETETIGMWGFGLAAKHSKLFEFGQKAASVVWPLARILDRQTIDRLPNPVSTSFKRRVL
jgi:L-lactate dehydrogenase complex protein LldF